MFWVSNRNTSLIDLMRGYIGSERSHRPNRRLVRSTKSLSKEL